MLHKKTAKINQRFKKTNWLMVTLNFKMQTKLIIKNL